MEQIDTTKVVKFGGSSYIRIPAPFLNLMGWKEGMMLKVFKEGERLIYSVEANEERKESGIVVGGKHIP